MSGGQCPVAKYNVALMKSILHEKLDLAQLLNVHLIDLEDAPEAYRRFNSGEPVKYVFDPHGTIRKFLKGRQQTEGAARAGVHASGSTSAAGTSTSHARTSGSSSQTSHPEAPGTGERKL